jgi:hypothetical protein
MPQIPNGPEESDQPKKKKFLAEIFIVFAGAFVLQFIILKKPPFETVMKNTARELNKTCPFMANKDTRLDSARVLSNNTFEYSYTLVHFQSDSAEAEMLRLAFEPAILSNVKSNPDLALFRKNLVTFSYLFKDEAGNPVIHVKISPEQYLP